MQKQSKIIATNVPVSALVSKKTHISQGTFETGMLFLEWLVKTKQSGWQILPLSETHFEPDSSTIRVPSPYRSYGIGLSKRYLPNRSSILSSSQKKEFLQQNNFWVYDYALFCALANHFKTDDWRKWEGPIRHHDEKAISIWKERLKHEIDNEIELQARLHASYKDLKKAAQEKGIVLIGDVSFYLPVQSPLVWAYQQGFEIGENGDMRYVSGVPDTPKSLFGRQLWGHPLYAWDKKEKRETIINLWKARLRYTSTIYDSVRLDHAKGFIEYGVMDTQNNNNDKFRTGPGEKVFEELCLYTRSLGFIMFAEDSGEEVKKLRSILLKYNIPGIKIFRYAFNERKNKIVPNYAEINAYPENSVAFSTTHDTETLIGYLSLLKPSQRQLLAKASDISYDSDIYLFAKNIRHKLLSSNAGTVILPIQDWLLITDRINIPGTEKQKGDTNWRFILPIPLEELPTHFH